MDGYWIIIGFPKGVLKTSCRKVVASNHVKVMPARVPHMLALGNDHAARKCAIEPQLANVYIYIYTERERLRQRERQKEKNKYIYNYIYIHI